ncbi:hypothetical protein QUA56_27960 [Microcoleus sp. N3A4]|uniref:hypothetical protein n=1 Tax=Microcoleus sp. N3A4 TaxID=3055379 RepID=UPI002FD19544
MTEQKLVGQAEQPKPAVLNNRLEVMRCKRSIDPQHNPTQNCTKEPDQNFNFAIAQLPCYRALSRTIPDHVHIN